MIQPNSNTNVLKTLYLAQNDSLLGGLTEVWRALHSIYVMHYSHLHTLFFFVPQTFFSSSNHSFSVRFLVSSLSLSCMYCCTGLAAPTDLLPFDILIKTLLWVQICFLEDFQSQNHHEIYVYAFSALHVENTKPVSIEMTNMHACKKFICNINVTPWTSTKSEKILFIYQTSACSVIQTQMAHFPSHVL